MIPVNTPLLGGNELIYLSQCITTGWISSEGPFIAEFEKQFATYVERKHAIAVSNGSAALDIAVKAIGVGPGDEVIMPAFTIISPAQSVVYAGGVPVLVDSDPLTWNMDVNLIEQKITARTKAILVVHIYGLPVEMDPIVALCKKHGLKLIEDAAEMHGQTYKGQKCGSFGDISTFSFYPNKHITAGEGGMIVCNDEELAEKCKKYRNLAFEPKGRRFVHEELGWNYRMTNMQAAIGLAQLERIDYHVELKHKMGQFYQEHLAFMTDYGFQLPLAKTDFAQNIYWVFGLVSESQAVTDEVVHKLGQMKIGTRPFFWCMHEQPVFRKMGLYKNEHYPVSEMLARNGFYIPSGLGLTESNQAEVVAAIKKILQEFK
jgi:perosamine synthetase